MSHLFRSLNGHRKPVAPTPEDLAREMALDLVAEIKARRAEATAAELNCEESIEATPEDRQRYEQLEALLKGRHRTVVLHVLLEHFPELMTEMKVH